MEVRVVVEMDAGRGVDVEGADDDVRGAGGDDGEDGDEGVVVVVGLVVDDEAGRGGGRIVG